MIKSPDLAAIRAAELRVIAAKERTAAGGHRAWLAMKSALARPSSLAIVAGAGFCGGLWLSRPRATRAPSADKDASTTAGDSFASLVLAFALRHAAQLIPVIVSRVWAERRSDEACSEADHRDINRNGVADNS